MISPRSYLPITSPEVTNHTGGLDIGTNLYSWSGQPLVVVTRQQNAGPAAASITTISRNSYDALGRLVKTTKEVAGTANGTGVNGAEKVIAINKYDALGQLATKTLQPANANGTTGLELQSYDYNIRGWLLGMNRDYVNNTNSTKFFGFDLAYDKTANLSGINNYAQALYNGNISGITWRGSMGSKEVRRYDYAYDPANRLLKGDFQDFTNSGNNAAYDIKMGDGASPNTAYDYNGNILAMAQKGLYSGSAQTIDQLTYTYNSGSNKLAKVADAGVATTGLGDFADGNNSDDDYAYDVNGNLTQDKNKDISGITYNILNLPKAITVTGKANITYIYDAAGNKLSKTVNETGQPAKTTTYLGGMIFPARTYRERSYKFFDNASSIRACANDLFRRAGKIMCCSI